MSTEARRCNLHATTSFHLIARKHARAEIKCAPACIAQMEGGPIDWAGQAQPERGPKPWMVATIYDTITIRNEAANLCLRGRRAHWVQPQLSHAAGRHYCRNIVWRDRTDSRGEDTMVWYGNNSSSEDTMVCYGNNSSSDDTMVWYANNSSSEETMVISIF
eukprot:848081-Pleurochrysis_carterae.AAC.3